MLLSFWLQYFPRNPGTSFGIGKGHDDGSSVGIRKLRLQYGAGDWANQVEPCVKH